MRRKPFDLKEALESEGRKIDREEQLEFDEGYLSEREDETLERLAEVQPRLRFFSILVFIIFAVALVRLYDLAIIQHDKFFEIAQGNRLRIEYLPAPRGAVYDRNGEVLASNRPSFELSVTPLDLPQDPVERAGVVARVAEILGQPAVKLNEIISANTELDFQSVLVEQGITREQALIFSEQARTLPGFRVINTPIRQYDDPGSYAHLIGFVGKITADQFKEKAQEGYLFNDTIGKTGLEQVYEAELRGTFGERQVEVDAKGSVKKVYGESVPQQK